MVVNERLLANKHMGDMLVQDRLDLMKVVNADFRRSRRDDSLESSIKVKKMKVLKSTEKQITVAKKSPFSRAKTIENNSESDEDHPTRYNLLRRSS